MKKIPLFEYAYKLPFDRIENLVNNIEEHGVLMNDRFVRETELSPNHEDVAKALNEVERAINLNRSFWRYRLITAYLQSLTETSR